MPRIILAYWHGEHGPGDEIDVSDEDLAALQRDGRVAEVVGFDNGGSLKADPAEAVNDTGEAGEVTPPPTAGRKRR